MKFAAFHHFSEKPVDVFVGFAFQQVFKIFFVGLVGFVGRDELFNGNRNFVFPTN